MGKHNWKEGDLYMHTNMLYMIYSDSDGNLCSLVCGDSCLASSENWFERTDYDTPVYVGNICESLQIIEDKQNGR